jgi:hypothetical protein
VETQGASSHALINVDLPPKVVVIFDGIYVKNSAIEYKNVVVNNGESNQFVLVNSVFENVTVETGNSLINWGAFRGILLQNISFYNVTSLDFSDDSSSLVKLGTLNLNNDMSSVISNVKIESSSLSFFILNNIEGETTTLKQLQVSNVTILNCDIKSQMNIINIGYIGTSQDFQIVFNFIKFNHIVFQSKGNLFSFNHHTKLPILVTNSEFSQIEKGSIYIEGVSPTANPVMIHVQIINSTFFDINEEYTSLIITLQYAFLQIHNSQFSNVFWFEKGSIIHSDIRFSEITMTNSSFVNNTAIEGGLFDLYFRGRIHATDWTFRNNFALKDTIFHIEMNSFFNLLNCTITENYAIIHPIGELVDTIFPSSISSTTIFNNLALSKSEVIKEFTSSCTYLCFVDKIFKTYVLSNQHLMPTYKSSYLLQIMLSIISINNSTKFYNQTSLFDIFSSNFSVNGMEIEDIGAFESVIVSTSSTVALNAIYLKNASSLNHADSIINVLESQVTIANITMRDCEIQLLKARTSSLTFSLITIQNIKFSNLIVSIADWFNVNVTKVDFVNVTTNVDELFKISNSQNVYLTGISTNYSSNRVITIDNSEVAEIIDLSINNSSQALFVGN